MTQRKHPMLLSSAYVRLDTDESDVLPPSIAPARAFRRWRRAALLSTLVLVLGGAYVALSWSTHLPSCLSDAATGAAFELTASPPLIEDGSDLVVSWPERLGCATSREDYVTLSCGPTVDDDDVFQRRNVTQYDATPNSVRFSALYMMRCTYVVKYVARDHAAARFRVLATLHVPMKQSPHAPKHGHIAFGDRDDAMIVMFNSASTRVPLVRFGLRADALDSIAYGTTTTYAAHDMCHAPANTTRQQFFRDPGFMHTVTLANLTAATTYFYQFGNDNDGWSRVAQFRSKPSQDTRVAKFIAYGDMGVDNAPAAQSTAQRVLNDVVSNGYDSFLLHFGDISYARGKAHIWDQFFHLIEPYATRVPYMVSIGNHEYDYTSGGEHDPSGGAGPSGTGFHPAWGNYGADSGGECSVPMRHRWHAPSTGNSIYWYSFDYASIHVVQISTEHDWTRGSAQYNWLQRDLERVDRNVTPWIIVTGHRMMYTTQIMGSECTANLIAAHMRSELEELLHANRVNLMLVGHQHAYERSCPVYKGECQPDGKATVHVLAGAAGFEIDTTAFSTACGNWSRSHVNAYGYLRVAASSDTMRLEFVLNANGTVYDEVDVLPWVD